MNKYLSFGGGVNSVALHLLLLEQGEDFESVFVNHGTDWPETYHYVAMFQWWLKANGHKPITILRPNVQGHQCLYKYYYDKKIIPYRRNRDCTHKFKVRPLEAYQQTPCFVILGIDYGEAHRAKIVSQKGYEYRYPLIEHEIDRDGCIKIIKQAGLPVPPKSGCFICPQQKRQQVIELRHKHPDKYCQAKQLEDRAGEQRKQLGKPPVYLFGSSYGTPISAFVNEKQNVLFEEYEYPPCQCGL
ncbi:MAG: hypothetical protein ACQEQ0_09770 [Bacteroidota bacterium]